MVIITAIIVDTTIVATKWEVRQQGFGIFYFLLVALVRYALILIICDLHNVGREQF